MGGGVREGTFVLREMLLRNGGGRQEAVGECARRGRGSVCACFPSHVSLDFSPLSPPPSGPCFSSSCRTRVARS